MCKNFVPQFPYLRNCKPCVGPLASVLNFGDIRKGYLQKLHADKQRDVRYSARNFVK